jgi:hypothetical protein
MGLETGRNRPQRPTGGSKRGYVPPPKPPPAPPPRPTKVAAGRGFTHYTPKSDLHTNAAFTEEEEFAFLMGKKIIVGVPARSTWVEAAQYDEQSHTITLWTDRGDELGPYSGMGEAEAIVFAQATSKGAWYWAVVVGRGTVAALEPWSWKDPFGFGYQKKKKKFGQKGIEAPIAPKRQPQRNMKTWFRW